MPKAVKPLSDTEIRNAKPKEKEYPLSDGDGLSIVVTSNGGKWWRFNYVSPISGKRNRISFGTYPDVTLLKARELRAKVRQEIQNGVDPSQERKAAKEAKKQSASEEIKTFEKLFYTWIEDKREKIAETTYIKIRRTFEKYFIPFIGNRQIEEISNKEYKELILKMSDRGLKSYAYKAKGMLQGFLNYLDEKDIITAPSLIMTNTLPKPKQTNYANIVEQKELGELLRAIDNYQGDISTKYALKLLPLVFVRPANIRFMEWNEIDFEKAIWRIPAEKMKMDSPHIVPLSAQAIEILQEIRQFNGDYKLVFTSPTSTIKPLSENTLNQALMRMGYKDRQVSHGFRHTASTTLHEHISTHGFHSEVIERQLAHAERNGVKAAYNHAEYIKERTELMQWWADYLESLKRS